MAMAVHSGGGGGRALGGKCFGYALLRHDGGSIERRTLSGDDLRAQRARGGRVDEARVARMLDAMYNRGLAVVGVRQRGLALEASVRARAAADGSNWRLRARRKDARGRCQRSPPCHRRLAGGDVGPLYMVRRVPSTLTALRQWGGSSCTRTQGLARHWRGRKRAEGRSRRAPGMLPSQTSRIDGCPSAPLRRRAAHGGRAVVLKRAMKRLEGKDHSHMPPACSRSSSGGSPHGCAQGIRRKRMYRGPLWHSVTVQKCRRIQAPGAPLQHVPER